MFLLLFFVGVGEFSPRIILYHNLQTPPPPNYCSFWGGGGGGGGGGSLIGGFMIHMTLYQISWKMPKMQRRQNIHTKFHYKKKSVQVPRNSPTNIIRMLNLHKKIALYVF